MVISFVPRSEAESDIVMAGPSEIGGLGAAGAVLVRFVVDMLAKLRDSAKLKDMVGFAKLWGAISCST